MFAYGFSSFQFDQRELFCSKMLRPQLERMDKFMAGVTYVAGETLTFVDFMFWEMLDVISLFDATLFDKLENLKSYKTRFEAIPKVAEYRSSSEFMTAPICNRMAKWGGDAELTKSW